jgi:nitrous oxide reductase accessory protein NosL
MKKMILFLMISLSPLLARDIVATDANATDLVYMLPLKEFPKWICEAELKNGKKVQFASVKSMMQLFFHQEYFKKRKLVDDVVKTIYVQDFISGRKIEAQKAVYLFGSRMIGPHGDDLIPFESEDNAKVFMLKNGGTKILPYKKLSKGLIKYLDM